MSIWTLGQLQRISQGKWLIEPQDDQTLVEGVSIDTRTMQQGNIFLAITGDRFDGHDFLQQANDAGAGLLITDNRKKAEALADTRSPLLLVDNTIRLLGDLARSYRNNLRRAGTKVIAVTGSNGKTTTRRMIHAALASHFQGTQSPKSFNNHLGVPLTLLAASPDDRFVVVEVGTNHPGEIPMLADVVRPDVAVVTNIGTAHIGNFGSREAIGKEKLSLVNYLTRGGVAVLPGDLLTDDITLPDDCTLIRVGQTERCDLVARDIKLTDTGTKFQVQSVREDDPFGGWQMKEADFTLSLLGKHNALNALAALAVSQWMCLDFEDEKVAAALASIEPAEMRLALQHVGLKDSPITLIVDCYNANRDSMFAAIDVLAKLDTNGDRRRVAILGDMLELGDLEQELHASVGSRLAENAPVDCCILIGEAMAYAADAAKASAGNIEVHHFAQWTDDLPGKIAKLTQPNDIILLKASRGMALERLIPEIEKAASRRTSARKKIDKPTDV